MKTTVRTKKIKAYLLKGNHSFISYIKNTNGFTKKYFPVYKDKMGSNYISGIIYMFSKKMAIPPWANYVREMTKFKQRKNVKFAENQDERGLVFLRISVTDQSGNTSLQTYVLTFGGGHHLLKSELIVKDFATKVSRAFIQPDKVTSIDSVTIEKNTFNTRKTTAKNLPKNKLLVRGELSLIKKIHGRSKLNQFIATANNKDLILGGENGLDITGNFNLREDLIDLLVVFGKEYLSNNVKFNINELLLPVTNIQIQFKLNNLLSKKLKKIVVDSKRSLDQRNIRGIDIQPPFAIEFDDFNGFFITGLWYKDHHLPGIEEINVLDFFEKLRVLHRTRNKFNTGLQIIEKLKSSYIEIKHTLPNVENSKICSIFNALIMEFALESSKYLLFNGKWFEVNKSFYSSLKSEIDSLPEHPSIRPLLVYPKYKNRAEKIYNKDLSKTNKILLLDHKDYPLNKTKLKNLSLKTKSSLEICDAFRYDDDDIEFIHVKRKGSSSSSGTSHLVAQAVSSATAFNEIPDEIINHIQSLIPKGSMPFTWKNQNRHVSLVILNEKYTPTSKPSSMLSILEILTVLQNVQTLKELGYNVYLKIVG